MQLVFCNFDTHGGYPVHLRIFRPLQFLAKDVRIQLLHAEVDFAASAE